MSRHTHRQHDTAAARCAVITVSDTRTAENDSSGQRIQKLLQAEGHHLVHYQILKDEPHLIAAAIQATPTGTEVVIINGGTGVAHRDTTYEAVSRLLEKEIRGFGELFRMLSYEQIGAAAMLSRATAGVVGQRVVFALPGSTAAVELALTKLILPELRHIVGLLRQ